MRRQLVQCVFYRTLTTRCVTCCNNLCTTCAGTKATSNMLECRTGNKIYSSEFFVAPETIHFVSRVHGSRFLLRFFIRVLRYYTNAVLQVLPVVLPVVVLVPVAAATPRPSTLNPLHTGTQPNCVYSSINIAITTYTIYILLFKYGGRKWW